MKKALVTLALLVSTIGIANSKSCTYYAVQEIDCGKYTMHCSYYYEGPCENLKSAYLEASLMFMDELLNGC